MATVCFNVRIALFFAASANRKKNNQRPCGFQRTVKAILLFFQFPSPIRVGLPAVTSICAISCVTTTFVAKSGYA